MSELFYAAGDLDRAEEWGQRGLTIAVLSTARQLYSTLALVQARLGEADVAERTARAGLEAFPDDFQLHLSLAMALQQTGRFSEAIAHYRESLRLNPDQERADKIREEIEALETGRR